MSCRNILSWGSSKAPWAALLAAGASLTGCIIPTPGLRDQRYRLNLDAPPSFVEAGRTAREEVILTLGEPDWASPDDRRLVYVWG